MDKNCIFQYATTSKIYEDTGLITLKEAEELWDKYYPKVRQQLIDGEKPQMCIWINCVNEASYHTTSKEIDYRDCEVKNGKIYKVETKMTEII